MPRMKARKAKDAVTILPPGPIQQELCPDGKWILLRDFVLEIDGEEFVCPKGLRHDGSSWPRCLPGPRQRRIMAAGVAHDTAFQLGTFGEGGRKIGFWEANGIWYKVSRAGVHHDSKAGPFWGRVGWAGLIFSYPTWLKYRRASESTP